jgi:hypothetical protein
MVVVQEATPFVGDHRSVCLDAIIYLSSPCIPLLQFHGTLVKRERAHEGLAPMPRKEHLFRHLGLDIFLDELFQKRIAHDMIGGVLVQLQLFSIVTIVASQVAMCSSRLQHDVERSGEG